MSVRFEADLMAQFNAAGPEIFRILDDGFAWTGAVYGKYSKIDRKI